MSIILNIGVIIIIIVYRVICSHLFIKAYNL